MNCGDVRSYLHAFLDNELDAPLSIDVQRHLDGCHECAREAEIERSISKRLAQAIRYDRSSLPAFCGSLDDNITFSTDGCQEQVSDTSTEYTARNGARMVAVAATLAIVVGATGWFMFGDRHEDLSPSHFSDLVVADFQHFLDEGSKLQIESSDRSDVSRWLESKTQLAMALPDSSDPRCRLLGGRKCTIAGAAAAFAVYEMNGVTASLVALPSHSADLESMTAVQSHGSTHWVAKRGAYTVLAKRRGDLIYAAAAQLPMEELTCLLKSRRDEKSKN